MPCRLFLQLLCLLILGCTGQKTGEAAALPAAPDPPDTAAAPVTWTYRAGSLRTLDFAADPGNVPRVPHALAPRISAAAAVSTNGTKEVFFLVNGAGVLPLPLSPASPPAVVPLAPGMVSAAATFDTLTAVGDTLVFHAYISDFASPDPAAGDLPVLIRYQNGVYSAAVHKAQLYLPADSRPTDITTDGKRWHLSAKSVTPDSTSFAYRSFTLEEAALEVVPAAISDTADSREDVFRAERVPRPWSRAPAPLRTLLAHLGEGIDFEVTLVTSGAPAVTYAKGNGSFGKDFGADPLIAHAFLQDGIVAVLFADGSFFHNKAPRAVKASVPREAKFPPLPPGFRYSFLAFTDETVYAAWEERSFYQVASTGLTSLPWSMLFS